jgi:GTP-binding protein YchF
LKIGIIGLPNVGKTTIFNALTGQRLETSTYPNVIGEPHRGIVKVPDSRLDKLSEIFKPQKTTHATIEYIDYIGITKGDTEQNKKVFDLIKDVDAVVHVVRTFKDDVVVHPTGNIDPLTDIENVELELIFGDLVFVEKRLERMEMGKKQGKKPDESERHLLILCKDRLEKETALRNEEFSDEEKKAMRPLQFLSTKPEIVILNTGEKDLNTDYSKNILLSISNRYPSLPVLTMCGKIEMELAQLSHDEARLFFDDLGIGEPASDKIIRSCYEILGVISFFTYVGDEVRAWTITRGANALKAAGKVHSDMEKGFIKAEVISFDDFISTGSIQYARDKGMLRLEGKTYEVKDGDIINFRFNV